MVKLGKFGRIKIIICLSCVLLCLSGCASNSNEVDSLVASKTQFTYVPTENAFFYYWIDNETHVVYMVLNTNGVSMTPRLHADGTPYLAEEMGFEKYLVEEE